MNNYYNVGSSVLMESGIFLSLDLLKVEDKIMSYQDDKLVPAIIRNIKIARDYVYSITYAHEECFIKVTASQKLKTRRGAIRADELDVDDFLYFLQPNGIFAWVSISEIRSVSFYSEKVKAIYTDNTSNIIINHLIGYNYSNCRCIREWINQNLLSPSIYIK